MKPLDRIRMIRGLRVPATGKLILYDMAGRANGRDTAWPSAKTIAHDTGLHRVTVSNTLIALRAAGLIVWQTRRGTSSVYRLTLPRLQSRTTTHVVQDYTKIAYEDTRRQKPRRTPAKPISPRREAKLAMDAVIDLAAKIRERGR